MKRFVNVAGLLAACIVLFVAFSLRLPEVFPTMRNVETILIQTIIVGFAAIGMTLIIMTGAIDLSVGSLVALITVVTALLLQQPIPPIFALLGGLCVGGVAGLLNGVLVTKLKVGAFIVTLATLLAFRGFATGLANEGTVTAPLNAQIVSLTGILPSHQKWMLLPPGGWLVVLFALMAGWLLSNTVFGRHIIATGSNAATARMCGINTDRVIIIVFLIAGFCFGMAGVMQFSRLSVGDPVVANGLELSVIAAVVIGGASLTGGEGSIAGSLLGALIMTMISTGASQMGMPNWVQQILTGAIILGAVTLDRWRMVRHTEKSGGD